MALCDQCGNFNDSHILDTGIEVLEDDPEYQPDLYYYWDAPLEEDYDWRDAYPDHDCMCEICFDIANSENKIKWECASQITGTLVSYYTSSQVKLITYNTQHDRHHTKCSTVV